VQFQHGDLPGPRPLDPADQRPRTHRLQLEITEGVLISDSSRALSILRRLKLLGVRIAMDDFRHRLFIASLSAVVSVRQIKIDKSFITNVKEGTQSAAIVAPSSAWPTGSTCRSSRKASRSPTNCPFLRREGCKEVQGYLVGRPCPIEDYAEETHGRTVVGTRNTGLVVASTEVTLTVIVKFDVPFARGASPVIATTKLSEPV